MYAKEELTWCNHFSTAHIVGTQSQKHREYTSNSYPSFIDIPQHVTLSLPNLLTIPVNTNWKKT